MLLIAKGFWAAILFLAAWKRSWAGRDPIQNKTSTDGSVANTGVMVQAQLLTA